MKTKVLVSQTFAFEKEIARLNKKAFKIGVPLIDLVNLGRKTVTRTCVVSFEGETSEERVPVEVTEYEVTLPDVEDRRWTFCATLTPMDGEAEKVFVDAHVKDFDTTPWRQADPCHCDHCHARRNRALTYVVQNKDDGRFMQLGRNCFGDYVGFDTLTKLEFRAVIGMTLGEGDDDFIFGGGTSKVETVRVRTAVAVAETIAKLRGGWVNNTYDDFDHRVIGDGTHRMAAKFLNGRETVLSPAEKTEIEALLQNPSHSVWAEVDAAIERIQGMDIPATDDFGTSLKYCAEFAVVPCQKAGMIAYLGQFLRNHDRTAAYEAKKEKMVHVGVVGKRQDFFNLKTVKVISFEGFYGRTYIHIFEDAVGNELVWKTSNPSAEEGQIVNLKATVKEHGEYKGAKQTTVSRAKVVNVGN